MQRKETVHYFLENRDFSKHYDLTVSPDGSRIGFRVHPTLWDNILQRFMDPSQMANYERNVSSINGVSPLVQRGDSGDPWGFGEAIVEDTSGGCPVIEVKVPTSTRNYDASLSLHLIQTVMSLFEGEVEEAPDHGKQAVILDGVRVGGDFYGSSIWFTVSPFFRNCIREYVKGYETKEISVSLFYVGKDAFNVPAELQSVLEIMKTVYRRVFPRQNNRGSDDYINHDVRIHLKDSGGIHLEVPGNATGLDPDHHFWSKKDDVGYKLLPHNTDSPCQQLALFAGMAQLIKEIS